MDLHELTAAYALDALDADEAEAYEGHLGQCEECREQLAELNDTAASLAFATVAPAPPPRLRAAILDQAAAERTNVVPLRRRRWVTRWRGKSANLMHYIFIQFFCGRRGLQPVRRARLACLTSSRPGAC